MQCVKRKCALTESTKKVNGLAGSMIIVAMKTQEQSQSAKTQGCFAINKHSKHYIFIINNGSLSCYNIDRLCGISFHHNEKDETDD